MSIAQNYPIVSPALLLDFANVQALDPRISFSRATTATYYGTRTAKAEENLLLQSQAFNVTWVLAGVTVTANSAVAPDGTTTADKIIPTATSSSFKEAQQNISVVATLNYTASYFVKADGYNFVQLVGTGADIGTFYVNFDLSTGTETAFSAGTSTIIGRGIDSIGNGWYRIRVTIAALTSSSAARISLDVVPAADSVRGVTWSANGTDGVLLWGAQVEQRSTVTAYTPTTTQPVTNYIPVLETAASGVARFDHNPVTFESLGLLIEELRTNLLLRSEEFDNAVWTKGNTTITANTAIAPDGNLTADKAIVNSGAQASVGVYQDVTALSASTAYTVSAFVKKAGAQYAVIGWIYTGAVYAAVAYDLDTLTVSRSSSAGGFTITGNSITSVGNGWYRITITATVPSTGALGRFPCVFPRNTAWTSGNPDGADTGDGYAGIFIWGAQLE